MNYNLIRPILFKLDPELSHNFTLKAMKQLDHAGVLKRFTSKIPSLPKTVFGLTFDNPIGLAAGLDKNGDYIDALATLGFGFIEIGTVTPKPQAGNARPRLFRLVNKKAIINRMGFNNKGVEHLVAQVKKKKYQGILGINIGKNAITPLEKAIDDYRFCLNKVYSYASYVTVNISSPNTPGLRHLQSGEYLENLLEDIKKEQALLANTHNKYVPVLIKIAPDLTDAEILTMANAFGRHRIDGIIISNTTLDRDQVEGEEFANEAGGLSGEPLFNKSTEILKKMKKAVAQFNIPIIGSGGVMSAQHAAEKFGGGAELVQLYSGLIYEGPKLLQNCVAWMQQHGIQEF